MQIRPATLDDAHALAELHIASWRAAYDQIVPARVLDGLSVDERADRHRSTIASGIADTAVAEVDGGVVGFCVLGHCRDEDKPQDNTGEIWGIYLAPSHWRRGIGSDLLRWAEAELLRRGKAEVVLWVLDANSPSKQFYEANGYVQDGTRKELTIGKPLTAVRYAKSLQPVR